MAEGDCDNPTCGGNGVCIGGKCRCSQGYKGEGCREGEFVGDFMFLGGGNVRDEDGRLRIDRRADGGMKDGATRK